MSSPLTFDLSSSTFGERLVTLSDGRSGLRSGLQVDTVEASQPSGNANFSPEQSDRNISAGTLDFIASDETLDRCDEIIAASGWRLESYRRNPVFQNAHQYGDVIFTLGKAVLTEVRLANGRPALFQRVQFAVEANPMARITHALYKGKFLNAVSVGFIPLRWENGNTMSSGKGACLPRPSTLDPFPLTRGSRLPNFRRRYLEQELLEVSAVGIPANPNALQLGLKAGAIQKSDLQELTDLLRSFAGSALSQANAPELEHSTTPISDSRSHPAVPDTHARASGVRSYEAQLLQLARDVVHVLRNT